MTVVVIANPVAGRGRAVGAARAAVALIEARGVEVVLQQTTAPGHGRELARAAAAQGAGCVLAVGGDGTLNEVASGLAHSACAMGVLAAGRGNDFAGALGLPHDAAGAAAAVLAGISTATDLGVINGKVFLTVAATGFDAAVARRVHDGGFRIFGGQAYLAAALWMLPRWPAPSAPDTGRFRGAGRSLSSRGGGEHDPVRRRHHDDAAGVPARWPAGVLPHPRPLAAPGAGAAAADVLGKSRTATPRWRWCRRAGWKSRPRARYS